MSRSTSLWLVTKADPSRGPGISPATPSAFVAGQRYNIIHKIICSFPGFCMWISGIYYYFCG